MKTRFLATVVVLFATTALWAYKFKSGDLYYQTTSDSTVETVYSDNYPRFVSVIIPKSVTYNGTTYRVTRIGTGTFQTCSSLTSITIPNSVTGIGESAFAYCSSLTSVTIPNSVTSIGQYAFRRTPLYDNQPDGVVYINRVLYAYKGTMPQGTNIVVKEGTICISDHAFYDCSDLTSVTIPNSVTSIGSGAFSGCSGLTSVTIPNSVTSIGSGAFSGCSGLTSVTIPNSVTSIGVNAFNSCSGLTSATIGNGVTSIGEEAFYGCSNLETVTFGSGLQNIGDNAFQGCQNIYEMTVYATQVPNVVAEKEGSTSYGTFQGVSKLAELHVPAESVKKYKIHPVWGLFNVITAIPYTVTLLCDNVQGAVVGSGSYQPNEQVTITAKANAGYRFVQWSDGITTNPRTIVVVSDTTLTAEFEEIPASEYTVSVVVDPAQHGAVQMTLTAVPDEGYHFTNWSDGNTENPRTILVTENMTLSATFVLGGTTTKMNNTPAEESPDGTRKVFRNGQVYILRGDKTYTATGIQL